MHLGTVNVILIYTMCILPVMKWYEVQSRKDQRWNCGFKGTYDFIAGNINGNRIIPILTAVENTVPDVLCNCCYPFLWATLPWIVEPN